MSNPVSSPNLSQRALIALLIGAAGISLSPIFVRLSEIGPTATAFHRLFLALPVLWLWMALSDRFSAGNPVYRKPSSKNDYWRLTLAGLFFAGDLVAWHWSIAFTSIANSTLLANFAPIFVTITGFAFFGERFSRTFLAGMMCAIVGVVFLLGDSFALKPDHMFGDALGLLTAGFYAAYLIAVGRLRQDFSTATVMTWSGAISCAVLIPVTLLSGESFIAPSLFGWAMLLGLALLSQAGGQSLIAFAFAHLPAAFGAVALLLQPALATLLAWFIFDEAVSIFQGIGGLIILAGIYLARKGSQ